jgi:hypothetical protein
MIEYVSNEYPEIDFSVIKPIEIQQIIDGRLEKIITPIVRDLTKITKERKTLRGHRTQRIDKYIGETDE